ncbi:Hpt domain-containing protein [Paracoccus aminophilus]|uniref:Hpt protein n=1 Tax=Paracoccus aminophilus JCM 7686 TaxID=1367847 RepID=S5YE45_PARAH|nr:Hpt domain-containing protein [Paracoccus aminophilus]AGT09758.1 Hpt protein [Paracoccus aminophilus JCM 7686]
MQREVGDDEFRPILELFLDEIETIAFRLAGDDPQRMERDFHFLKGCARNLGFRALAAICDEFEQLVISGRMGEVRLDRVFDIYAQSKQLFMGELARNRASATLSGQRWQDVRSGTQRGSGHA